MNPQPHVAYARKARLFYAFLSLGKGVNAFGEVFDKDVFALNGVVIAENLHAFKPYEDVLPQKQSVMLKKQHNLLCFNLFAYRYAARMRGMHQVSGRKQIFQCRYVALNPTPFRSV